MATWKNLDTLDSFGKLKELKNHVDIAAALSGEEGGKRVADYSTPMAAGLSYNYAAKQVDDKVLAALVKLAEEAQLAEKFEALYNGEVINTGEKRLVLHHMTRGQLGDAVTADGVDKRSFYVEQQERIADFANKVHSGEITNAAGEKFTTVVQIGIGGSDLGPRAMYLALENWAKKNGKFKMEAKFISNVDPDDAAAVLNSTDVAHAIFVLVSKSGTTLETLTNESFVKDALKKAGLDPSKHMIAVTSETSPLAKSDDYLAAFFMDDYIGGRFSSTSAVGGAVLSLAFGPDVFAQFLEGAAAEDQLSASVWIQQGESHYTAALLKNRLSEAGVTSGLQEETIQQLANGLLYDQWVVVAKGTPCVNGEDGWYEYAFHRETDHKPKILEDGSVDYSQYGNIPSVKEGDVIAVYHPATEAKDGMDVHGNILVARKGKNLARLFGKGFACAEDGCTYIANRSGKIVETMDKIFIDQEFVVEGDLTNSTGSICFRGDIRIRGNVGSGVSVVSEKGSILVDGFVEGADLQANRDITLKNGMQGNGKGFIRAKGNVSAKFFEQCTICADGCVNANAIMNCQIEAGEDVVVSGRFGSIIGGHISAQRQIKATNIGNVAEVENQVEAGVAENLVTKMNLLTESKKKALDEWERIAQGIERIDTLMEQTKNAVLMEKKRVLMRGKIEKDTEISELEKKIQATVLAMEKANVAKVTVDRYVHPGTCISVNGMKTQVQELEQHVEYARRGNGIIVYHIDEA